MSALLRCAIAITSLLLVNLFSLHAQEVHAPNVMDIYGFPYTAEVKSVRLIDLQFTIDQETYEEEEQYDNSSYDPGADTMRGTDQQTVEEVESDTLYDPFVFSQFLTRISHEHSPKYMTLITGEIVFEYDERDQCISKVESSSNDKGAGPYNDAFYWQTTYNEKGFPVRCVYTVKRKFRTEVRILTWEYEYR